MLGVLEAPKKRPFDESALDDLLYEVVDGEIVEKPNMGARELALGNTIGLDLNLWANQSLLGRAYVEMLFDLIAIGQERRPDVAYVSFDRWPAEKQIPFTNAWEVVPNLAIEVVSKSNAFSLVMRKIQEYFGAGVERVWIVIPSLRKIQVYSSANAMTTFNDVDFLTDEQILPGFSKRIADWFDA